MNKFSITRLEEARQNPSQFAKSLKLATSDTFSGRFSKYMAWQLSVYEYHKTNDIFQALNYFEQTFSRNFADTTKNRNEREQYILKLHTYATAHSNSGLIYVEHKKRIQIFISKNLVLTGEIPIINMNKDFGYCAYFFCRNSLTWETELRFPLLQYYIANELYGVDISNVEVGVFDLDNERFMQNSFTSREINAARNELGVVGAIVTSIL